MYHNYQYDDINEALPDLMRELLDGDEVGSRGGSRTLELTHVGITLNKSRRREILNPVRKANIAAQIVETMWVLAGRNDIEFLSHYLPRAEQFSDDGKTWRAGYGPRLRDWRSVNITGDDYSVTDQLAEVIRLMREDRSTRRAVMSIFDPAVDYRDSKDIPCNNWLSFLSRLGNLDLHVAIRSNDLMWGLSGINAFEWSALQEIVAGMLGLEVGGLHFSITSLHLYDVHGAKAKKIVDTPPTWTGSVEDSPRFNANVYKKDLHKFDVSIQEWFLIEELIRKGEDAGRLIDQFPEPMLRSWLRVLQWWWSGDKGALLPLAGTRLAYAADVSLQPPYRSLKPWAVTPAVVERIYISEEDFKQSEFIRFATNLHNEKHKAYGDSWKRRGEMLGIMANIARKVDRLGKNGGGDTAADTAVDLMVYLAKYRWWLAYESTSPHPFNVVLGPRDLRDWDLALANKLLGHIDEGLREEFSVTPYDIQMLETGLMNAFESLEMLVTEKRHDRHLKVDDMLRDAYRLARTLWEAEQVRAKQRDHALRNATRSWNPEAGQ